MPLAPLAYSTNGFTTRPLIESLEVIARCGYAGVELLGDRPHWRPEQGIKYAKDVRQRLDDLGLEVSNVNGNTAMFFWPDWMPETVFEPALSHPEAAVRRRRIDSAFALFDWARSVEAPRVSVTSGRCPGGCPPQEATRYFIESLNILAERADQIGLQLSVEYEPGLLIERWTELHDVIERVDHPALGANLDLGHARCVGEDPLEAITGLAGRIWNVHVEDILGRKHYHLIPGEGDMDFGAYFNALDTVGYTGMLTVELYTYAEGDDERAALSAFKALSAIS